MENRVNEENELNGKDFKEKIAENEFKIIHKEVVEYLSKPKKNGAYPTRFYIVSNNQCHLLVLLDNIYANKPFSECVKPIKMSFVKKFARTGDCKIFYVPDDPKCVLDVRVVNGSGIRADFDELLFQTCKDSKTLKCHIPDVKEKEMTR